MTTNPTTAPPQRGPGVDATPAEQRRLLLDRVEARLQTFLREETARWTALIPQTGDLVDAVTDLVGAGGKRLRPAFCLTGFLAAGGDPADRVVVDAAAALELLQAFALIHDDVLDDSPLRRGVPTAHVRHAQRHETGGWRGEARRYGEGVAILAGDLAFAYADALMSGLPDAARQIWNELRIEMITGQYLDIAAAAQSLLDPQLARWIAICKSGHYSIHRPLVLGAAIAGRADLADSFASYGVAAGEAFQLRDDLIDAFGDTDVTGKPAGLDFAQQKMTFLLAVAMDRDERVRELVTSRLAASWDADALREVMLASGVRTELESHIARLVADARRALDAAPIPPAWREDLAELAFQVAYRDR